MNATVNTNSLTAADRRAAKFAVLASGATLPLGTVAELKAAYETLLSAKLLKDIHQQYLDASQEDAEQRINLQDLRTAMIDAPQAKRDAAIAAAMAALA